MSKIFISYRRSDTQMVAGRLRESLARRLGENAIFRDKNSIGAGEDWIEAIEASLSGDVLVLALIGPGWATARGDDGRKRLDDPEDWNRIELEQALKRSRRIIPLLVDDAKMPRESDVPESLRPLVRINALKLRDDDWDTDIERLARAIGERGSSSSVRRVTIAAAASVIVAAGAVAYWWLARSDELTAPSTQTEIRGGSFREDIKAKLHDEQEQALKLLMSTNRADKAKAIGAADANIARINSALESFPGDVYLHALAGYAAKNVFASSRDGDLLTPKQRQKYLAQARKHFEAALKIDPNHAGALNGMGNVSFYEGNFDTAIKYHELAIAKATGPYPHANHDLELVRRVKRGEVPFHP
jgi:tetratricopeptide (TPR) repeat protein